MDTPQRGQQLSGTAISRVEDSPVFNYICNLSPIKPLKSVYITHALNFSSPPSCILASPPLISQKEHKLPIRYLSLDSSVPSCSLEGSNEKNLSYIIPSLHRISDSGKEDKPKSKAKCMLSEATINLPEESLKLTPRSLEYDCGSPDHNIVPCFSSNMDLDKVKVSLVDFDTAIEDSVEKGQSKEEASGCEWENLITDGNECQHHFDPSAESEVNGECSQKVNGEETNYSTSIYSEVPENGISWQINQHSFQHVFDRNNPEQNAQAPPTCHNTQEDEVVDHAIISYEDECQNQRGIRRRCLVFELVGSKNSCSASFSDTSKEICEEKHQNSSKPTSGSNVQVLPSIGLHLNSLATSSKVRIAAEDNPSTGRKLLTLPCPKNSIHRNDSAVSENDQHAAGDLQELTTISGDELEPDSPKKKKCKLENFSEAGACRRCNCKKSKCLKLYCECFAAGVYCVGPCTCEGCFNKPVHEDVVLATRKQIEARNPLAFAPKVIRASALSSGIGEDVNKTPASARHKRGCNCKKSGCLKKYCECYQGGVGCSVGCRCEGCKNTFGRREGILPIVTEEPQLKEEQDDLCADLGVDFTPSFQNSRPPLLAVCHKIQKTVLQKSKLEMHFHKPTPDDETPRILRETASPLGGVKISSPNKKRVSPPHYDMGSSPNRKSGRRLILRSIPSLPSLAIFPASDPPENDFNC